MAEFPEKPELEGVEQQHPPTQKRSDRFEKLEIFEPGKTEPGLEAKQARNVPQTQSGDGSLSADLNKSQPQAPDIRTGSFPAAMRRFRQSLEAGLQSVLRLMRGVPAIGLVLAFALAAGFGVHWLLGDTEIVLDSKITRPEAEREMVTSLAWLINDQLMIGTASGAIYGHFISDGQTLAPTVAQHPIADIPGVIGRTGQGTVSFFNLSLDADLAREFDPEAPAPPLLRRVLLSGGVTNLEAEDGLFAIGGSNPTPLIVGRRALLGNQQQQQQQVATQTPVAGLFRYDIGPDGKPQEVGQVGSLWNVRALAAAPDGTFAVAGTGDGQVVAIDLVSTDPKHVAGPAPLRLGTVSGPVVAVAAARQISEPVIAAAGADGRVSIYKVAAVKPPQGLPVDDLAAYTYRASEAGFPAANWHIQNIAERYTLVAISDDGSRILASRAINETTDYYLLTVSEDGTVGEPTKLQKPFAENSGLIELPGMADAVFLGGPVADALRKAEPELASILAESLGSKIAAVSVDRNRDAALILMMDSSVALVTSAEPRVRVIGQITTGLNAVAINADGRLLATIGSDGQLSLYDISGATLASMRRAPQPPRLTQLLPGLSFSSDGRRIIVANGDDTIDLYSARDLHLIRREATEATFSGLAGSSGDFFLRKTSDESFEIVDPATGLPTVKADMGRAIENTLVSGDGRTAVLNFADGSLSIWREGDNTTPPLSGESFSMAAAPIGPPDRDGLKFSTDGSRLMLRTRNGRLYVAGMNEPETAPVSANRTETFFRFIEIPLAAPAVTADIAWDGSFLVAGEADNSLVLVDLTGAAPKSFELPEHGAVVNQLAISPDGAKVAAASLDGRVRIVDLARERFVAGLPLARLASYGDTPKMIARRLDDAPGTFPDTAYLKARSGGHEDAPAVIVLGSYSSLAAARAKMDALLPAYRAATGNGAAAVYLREGAYRPVFETSFGQAETFLQQVRKLAPDSADAYLRALLPWCPNAVAREGYTECSRPTPATPPTGGDIKKN